MRTTDIQKISEVLEQVCDPEIPVLSVTDMGIVREIGVIGEEPLRLRLHTQDALPWI